MKRKDCEHVKSVRYVNTLGRGVEGLGVDLKQDHQYRQVKKHIHKNFRCSSHMHS